MSIREQNLEAVAPVLATFKIHQTGGADDLTDDHIGRPVMLTASNEIGLRLATVQIGGICRLGVSATVPSVGDRVVGGTAGTIKQAPAVASDPAGGNVARGTVLAVNGTTDCVILLN